MKRNCTAYGIKNPSPSRCGIVCIRYTPKTLPEYMLFHFSSRPLILLLLYLSVRTFSHSSEGICGNKGVDDARTSQFKFSTWRFTTARWDCVSSGETRSSHRTVLGYGFLIGLTMCGGEVVFDTVIVGPTATRAEFHKNAIASQLERTHGESSHTELDYS